MQFQVPQFIETEDKIVGPLSLRQFLYVGAGVGISGMLYFVLQTWIWAILSVFFIGGSIAIAFIKIQGRPFVKVIASAFNFYWNPQTYVWQPEHPAVSLTREDKKEEKKKGLSVEDVLSGKALQKKWEHIAKEVAAAPGGAPTAGTSLADIAAGTSLHKSWASLQTGEQMSASQFTEKKMYGRYQIFQKISGERQAARRVDYR